MLIDEARGGQEFDEVIARAKQLARAGDIASALLLAGDVVKSYPRQVEGWLLRGFIHEVGDEYHQSITDMTRAIELNSIEPLVYYNRGRYLFQLGDHIAAASDFTQALSLCNFHRNEYYREELLFWRAEALVKLGKKEEALEDLSRVSHDFRSWTFKLRTKQDLLNDCGLHSYAAGDPSTSLRMASSR